MLHHNMTKAVTRNPKEWHNYSTDTYTGLVDPDSNPSFCYSGWHVEAHGKLAGQKAHSPRSVRV